MELTCDGPWSPPRPGGVGLDYFVTHEFLPAQHPLWGAVIRALRPCCCSHQRTGRAARGGGAAVLGALNTGVFFALIYLAAACSRPAAAATIMANATV